MSARSWGKGRFPCRPCSRNKHKKCAGGNCYCAASGHKPPRPAGSDGLSVGGTPVGCCGSCLSSKPVR